MVNSVVRLLMQDTGWGSISSDHHFAIDDNNITQLQFFFLGKSEERILNERKNSLKYLVDFSQTATDNKAKRWFGQITIVKI